ncbi:MAG: hypothetical protein ACK54F_03500 [Planctomycetia bacterium]|jgi:hypothetical protein
MEEKSFGQRLLDKYNAEPRISATIAKVHASSATMDNGDTVSQRFCRYSLWEAGQIVNYPKRYAAVKGTN